MGMVDFESTMPTTSLRRVYPSPLSCVQMRPAPPVSAHTPLQLPAEAAPGLLARSYSRHSHQSAAFESPVDKPAPDTTPDATLLARLFLFFTTAVTLVGRQCVRACQACPKLPLRHSFQRATTR